MRDESDEEGERGRERAQSSGEKGCGEVVGGVVENNQRATGALRSTKRETSDLGAEEGSPSSPPSLALFTASGQAQEIGGH